VSSHPEPWLAALTSVRCEASSIGGTKDMQAHDALFVCIADYFRQACSLDTKDKVLLTNLPPIYFQHQGLKRSSLSTPLCLLILILELTAMS
jgi:hypothetical protein